MFWFERSERPKPRARPAGKFRQEFYRKASLVGAVKFGSTAQVGPNFLPKRANCFARAQDLKAGALCEFEYEPREYERRAWRGGAASGEGQRADLWPSSWWAQFLKPPLGAVFLRPNAPTAWCVTGLERRSVVFIGTNCFLKAKTFLRRIYPPPG